MAKRRNELSRTDTTLTAHDASHVAQVRAWIVEGRNGADILADIRAQFLDDPGDLLMAAIEEIADEAANINHDLARGFLLNAYREIYRRAAGMEDYTAAVAALRSFERVAGL